MLQQAPELAFPETKPALESLRGRLVSKMSPRRRHGALQLVLGSALRQWARGRGEVASEWRFYLRKPRSRWSSLVPDLAYVSFARLPHDAPPDVRERPTVAPDLAIEILSPRERPALLEEKIALYLEFGSAAVVIVDPAARSYEIVTGRARSRHAESEPLRLEGFPDLSLDIGAAFAETD